MASTAYLLSLRKFKCFNVHRVFGRDRSKVPSTRGGRCNFPANRLCEQFPICRSLRKKRNALRLLEGTDALAKLELLFL